MRTGKKRYICSFIKYNEKGELKPNVVVVAARNDVIARALLNLQHGAVNKTVKPNNYGDYTEEGIKSIRLSETNTYEGEPEGDCFDSNS